MLFVPAKNFNILMVVKIKSGSENKKRIRLLVSCVLAFLFIEFHSFTPAYAQKDSLKTAKNDDSRIVPRYPDPKHLDKYKNDRDYNYNEDPMPADNPLDKWLDWLKRKINAFFKSKSYDNFWQYVIMAVTAVLVLYLLYKAKVLAFVFSSKEENSSGDYIVGQENIHEINFEDAIGSALVQKDYRLAIRLQYLKILKLLTVRELIHWKPNLTNQIYVQELFNNPYHADFVKITKYFEFAWYGDFQITEAGFKEMKDFSDSFVKKIGSPKQI